MSLTVLAVVGVLTSALVAEGLWMLSNPDQ